MLCQIIMESLMMQSRQPTTRCGKDLPYKVSPISPIQTPRPLQVWMDCRSINELHLFTLIMPLIPNPVDFLICLL